MSNFLDKFRKTASKIEGVDLDMHEPSFFLDSGNYIINRILNGTYAKCFPQGRLSAIAGPSSTGKTFVASNVARFALESGIGVLYVDTENAIDQGHFEAIGIDPEHPLLQYASVSTISQSVKVISSFIKAYRDAAETIPFLIIIDSIDMLETDSDAENYEKGEQKGGQGQKEKQLKKMLGSFVHDIKRMPMHMLCTKQVYVNQDTYTKIAEPWKFTESLKFAFSQILLVTKTTLKDKTTNEYNGFVLKAFGFKTRFAKPFQQCAIEVPYDTGMDRFTGVLAAAVSLDIVAEPSAGRFEYKGEKFQKSGFHKVQEAVLVDLIAKEEENIQVDLPPDDMKEGNESITTPEVAIAEVKKKFGKKVIASE